MGNFFWDAMRKNKKVLCVALIAVLGIVLIFASSYGEKEDIRDKEEKTSLDEYKERLENEIASLCSAVDGVGKCKVIISFERGEQTVYRGSSVVEVKPPEIKGVIIACRGADNDTVRLQLIDMMTALFDIGSNRVAISKLNS